MNAIQRIKTNKQSQSLRKPLIIAGPCSAETEEQVINTSRQLAETGKIDMLRFGIWKPRTRPGSFEGQGVRSLPWIIAAKQETGLPVSTEVANAKHVENALAFGVDVLWIGARSTVNPFTVQEIADALKGVHIPVMIKNPINPDVDLWSGAVERLTKAGITEIFLIHRGFSAHAPTPYRNPPMWHMPIEMKQRFPEIPVICDPSHICGNRESLKSISQRALDLDFDGLMIESHVTPDEAWSDAKQQLTPESLSLMLDQLIWRESARQQIRNHPVLADLRSDINQIDEQLLHLLAERMKISTEIGKYKKENNITILQTQRWGEILDKTAHKASELGMSKKFVKLYLEAIHMESIRKQNEVLNS
jgi:chorismate mutase